jgi:hypothetical protein
MSMQNQAGYMTDQETPVPRSIDFHNPGTAGLVVKEISQNYEELLQRRAAMEEVRARETAEYDAAHYDISLRIAMTEAAIRAYETNNQPEPPVGSMPR